MIRTLAVSGYRSLREFVLPLEALTVVTGPNGSGKSNLYRALRLLADAAQGRVVASLAREGGLASTLRAGPESFSREVLRGDQPLQGLARKAPVSLRIGFAGDDYGYAIDLGQPGRGSFFSQDPEIKREVIWSGPVLRPSAVLADRSRSVVRIREDRDWAVAEQDLATFDSMMTHCTDPRRAQEILMLRERLRGWRFYDQMRADASAPARLPQVGTRTPVLADDGSDLAAAIETIREIGDSAALDESVADAFPGSSVGVAGNGDWFETEMRQHGLLRPLKGSELSDGTLRYLLWVAALLTPRPPSLLVLNEPETSLHPDLLAPLARLVARAAERSQVLVVSHARPLIEALGEAGGRVIVLEKEFGQTRVAGLSQMDKPRWQWPAR
ncbi:MAG: AAA family ATPase [Acidobacteria bacterium]|nr:AAA family ATPase [Acidobacteriota bacterium]